MSTPIPPEVRYTDHGGTAATADLQVSVGVLWQQLSRIIHDWVSLLVLEGRLAGLSVAAMLALAVVAGLLLAGTWLFAVVAVLAWLHEQGQAWPALLAMAAGGNLILGLGIAFSIARLSRNLLFPAIRRSLAGSGSEPEQTNAQPAQA